MPNILEILLHALKHTGHETLRLLPFLFLTYLFMEFLEHKAGGKMGIIIRKAGRFGPLVGGALGVVPQCGFSASAAGLYAGRVVSLGTLFAVFLTTSDEMIPVAIAGQANPLWILKLLLIKLVLGVLVGSVIDLIFRRRIAETEIVDLCEEEHCHCEEGIFRSALHHTLHVALFLFLIGFALNGVVEWVGEDTLKVIFTGIPVIGQLTAAAVGLIPNCVSSVLVTELYLEGIISAGCLISGLLSGAGVGVLVLFRTNHRHMKENWLIVIGLLTIGTALGVLADLLPTAAFLT